MPYVDEHASELLFRHKVIRLLQGEALLYEERTELLLSWRHTGFSVHNRVRVEPEDPAAVERLARYILRPPFSLERMSWGREGEVRYRRKAGHDGGSYPARDQVETLDPEELLARVIMHIPEPRRTLIRYFGAYSNVSRGTRRRQMGETGRGFDVAEGPTVSGTPPTDERRLRRRWTQLITRVYEVDPLVCPSCGSEMKIIAIIVDHTLVDAILRHLARRGRGGQVRGPPHEAHREVAS